MEGAAYYLTRDSGGDYYTHLFKNNAILSMPSYLRRKENRHLLAANASRIATTFSMLVGYPGR
jgi:hypothetical protein